MNVNGVISTVVGGAPSGFVAPIGIAVDRKGNLYITDAAHSKILKLSSSGGLSTVAGTGEAGSTGDGGPATAATMLAPSGIAVDDAGSIYFADAGNFRVRKITANGTINTVAGNGRPGFSGDGGPATNAQLNFQFGDSHQGIAVDAAGNIYISDKLNNRIRMVNPAGIITTVAGNAGLSAGLNYGDGGPAINAAIVGPSGVALDAAGNLYIGDTNHNLIRLVSGLQSTPPAAPSVAISAIVNDASNASGAVSPGMIVAITGSNLAAASASADLTQTNVPGSLGQTSVLFDGRPAPLLSVSPQKIVAVAPYEIQPGSTTQVIVKWNDNESTPVAITVAAAAPGLYAKSLMNADGSVNSRANPAPFQSTITIDGTGEGQTTPDGVDGWIVTDGNTPSPVLPVSATLGGNPIGVSSIGGIAGQPSGRFRVQMILPDAGQMDPGDYPLVVQIGDVAASQPVIVSMGSPQTVTRYGPPAIQAGTVAGPFLSTDGGASWKQAKVSSPLNDATLSGLPNVSSIAVDPRNPSNVYAAARFAGVNAFLTSIDGGQTWSATAFPQLSFAGGLTIDPVKTNILYIKSQSLTQPAPPATVNPVLRSTDSGKTWAPLTVPNPPSPLAGSSSGPLISGIATDPAISGVLYVNGPATVIPGSAFVFKSTDYGDTWTLRGGGQNFGGNISVDPHNSQVLYGWNINTLFQCPSTNANGGLCGLYKSVDGGATWAAQSLRGSTVKSFAAGADPSTLYALTQPTVQDISLMQSADGGGTWREVKYSTVSTGIFRGPVRADPTVASTLYLGGVLNELLKSEDGGNTWTSFKLPDACANPNTRICATRADINDFVVVPQPLLSPSAAR
ncbi:MAG: hypothetical protein U0Q16_25140 [Bryobacteraceae bacterium]